MESINESDIDDIDVKMDKNSKNSKNSENQDGGDDGIEIASVSTEDPADMNETDDNKMEPPPAPNINPAVPKFTFQIGDKDSLGELTKEMLNKVKDENEKKRLIGERLFYYVKEIEGHDAGKITGYILSLDVEILFNLLSNKDDLVEKILLAKKAILTREKDKNKDINKTKEKIASQIGKMRQDLSKDLGETNNEENGSNDNSNNNNNKNNKNDKTSRAHVGSSIAY